jgi:hypothetical protein
LVVEVPLAGSLGVGAQCAAELAGFVGGSVGCTVSGSVGSSGVGSGGLVRRFHWRFNKRFCGWFGW